MIRRKRQRPTLPPTWDFPFRVGNGCRMVSDAVWNIRWTRHLRNYHKLARAVQFQTWKKRQAVGGNPGP